jgi:epoxide hydrolase 4
VDSPLISCFEQALPHGITLACRRAGQAGPRVMFLHGFPEAAFIWDSVMQALASEAQCLAPNLRGYAGSSAPAETDAYRLKHLQADLVALIKATGGPLDLLVAHDWGGAIAWSLAAQRPELLKRLLIINSPHPAAFLRELRHNPAQQAASQYMNFLVRPDAAALLAENDCARLWPFFERMGGCAWLGESMRVSYRQAWAYGLAGPTAWYKASPLRPPTSPTDPVMTLDLPDALVNVRVPTTVLWGDADTALLPGLLQGLERWVCDLRIERVSGASHWIVHEEPARVLVAVRQALSPLRKLFGH